MNKIILNKANQLNKQIETLKEALFCFEWTDGDDVFSTNPQLIIEYFNGDEREQIKLPMSLNDNFCRMLKDEIKKELNKYEDEFNAM